MPEMPPNGAGSFFLLTQTLPTFWAEWTWILIIVIVCFCWDPQFPDFQIPDFQISRCRLLDFQISKFLHLGTRFLAMASCGSGGAPVAGSRRFLDGTPRPQNSGGSRNKAILWEPHQCKPCLGNHAVLEVFCCNKSHAIQQHISLYQVSCAHNELKTTAMVWYIFCLELEEKSCSSIERPGS